MKKSYISLLTVAIIVASIIIGGCLTSNQANQATSSGTSTNASITTSVTSTSATTKAATASPTISPSPSATPTATVPATGKVVTSIRLGSNQGPPQLQFAKGDQINWIIEVTSSKQPMVCGAVNVSIDGKSVGHVTSGGSSDCFKTAYFTADTSSLSSTSDNKHSVTVNYVGDSTYQSSTYTTQITVT